MWRVAWSCVGAMCLGAMACGSSPTGDDDVSIDAPMTAMPLTADEAAKACAVYGSCLGDGVNDCVTDAMPFWSTTEARCMLAAGGDCTAVRACFGMTVVADASCTSSSSTCDGTNVVTCSGGVRATLACPDASPLMEGGSGPTCVATTTGGALCGTGSCSAASASCTGTVATGCNVAKGVMMSIDCAAYGKACTNGVCTAPGGGGTCTAGTPAHCDGASIVRCSGGIDVRTDCSTLVEGGSCHEGTTTNPEPYCGGGAACYPTKGDETCTGNAVTYCAGGVMTDVDCVALGFTSCFSGRCVSF